MILRNGFKVEPFIHAIEKHLGKSNYSEDGVYYFGGGYWRGLLIREDQDDEQSPVVGMRLINPSLTWEKINAVEDGIAVMEYLESEH